MNIHVESVNEGDQDMKITMPISMKYTLPDGKDVEIPEGAQLHVDESTNFCVMGGFIPDDPKIAEFKNDRPAAAEGEEQKEASTTKIVNFPLANTRLYRSTTGAVKTFPTRRWIKVRGQAVHQVEGLGSGSRIVVAGFLSSDKVVSKKPGKDFDYLDHLLAREVVVLTATKPGVAKPRVKADGTTAAKAEVPASVAALTVS
jgi:hypothetical protein